MISWETSFAQVTASALFIAYQIEINQTSSFKCYASEIAWIEETRHNRQIGTLHDSACMQWAITAVCNFIHSVLLKMFRPRIWDPGCQISCAAAGDSRAPAPRPGGHTAPPPPAGPPRPGQPPPRRRSRGRRTRPRGKHLHEVSGGRYGHMGSSTTEAKLSFACFLYCLRSRPIYPNVVRHIR